MLQNRLAGQSTDDALTYLFTELDLQPGTQPEIELYPGWFGKLPVLPLRINIRARTGA